VHMESYVVLNWCTSFLESQRYSKSLSLPHLSPLGFVTCLTVSHGSFMSKLVALSTLRVQ
jgi:hypothetical protein